MKSTIILANYPYKLPRVSSMFRYIVFCVFLTLVWNATLQAALEATPPPGVNGTGGSMYDAITASCGDSGNSLAFNTQCNALLSSSPIEQTEQVQIISPEQTGASGTNANKTSASKTSSANQSVMSRMVSFRNEGVTTRANNFQFYDNGNALQPTGISSINKGAASADDYSKLGLWVNGIFRFGTVDSTFQESKGYNYNNLGVTLGLDYAVTEDLIVGTAFTYLSTNGDYVSNGGDLHTDLFNGAIYASYYITDNFYIDGLAFYGGNNYDITRNVNYTGVNATLEGTPDGRQYGFNLSSSYTFNYQRLIAEPYVSVGYIGTDIDAYDEAELGPASGQGWATRYDAQNLTSLKTTLGALFAYNFDVPWGVLIPQIRGEWHHEFEGHGREITSKFIGNNADSARTYSVFIENPDRDYFTFGTSITSA
ncbi:autotransporter outer membrane beta-barrel domain-containing protein [Methyloprofundus sp.]|uniref:autotransporter outer membrane beta-barrel domain-containing protein n=1 Tax=Methyloprofundus sp. TaxID=2020875 RepID=UPI003D14259F